MSRLQTDTLVFTELENNSVVLASKLVTSKLVLLTRHHLVDGKECYHTIYRAFAFHRKLTVSNTCCMNSKFKQLNTTGGSSDVVTFPSSCSSKTTYSYKIQKRKRVS